MQMMHKKRCRCLVALLIWANASVAIAANTMVQGVALEQSLEQNIALGQNDAIAEQDTVLTPPINLPRHSLGDISTYVPLNAISPDTLKNFVTVIDLVRRKYDGDVNDEVLFGYAISGMLTQLDGHAEFLDETAFNNLQTFTEGSIADVGLDLEFDDRLDVWVVNKVVEQSAADQAGIKIGDYIYQIDTKKLSQNLSDKEVSQRLLGTAGSLVDIVTSQAGRNKRTLRLQRTTRHDDSLKVQVYNDVAVIRLPIFTDRTSRDMSEALARINTPIKAMVIDIRDNPGGVLSSAIAVASLFVEAKPIVQVIEKDKVVQVLSTTGAPSLSHMPVVILQNRYSASAAEILAQAFLLHDNAIVAGETSYGKGSIQSIIPLDNYEAIKLTTAHYTTPTGAKIDGVGITPHMALDFSDNNWMLQLFALIDQKKLEQGIILSLSDDY